MNPLDAVYAEVVRLAAEQGETIDAEEEQDIRAEIMATLPCVLEGFRRALNVSDDNGALVLTWRGGDCTLEPA